MQEFKRLLSLIPNPVLYETGGNQEFISGNIFDLTGYYAEEMRMNRDLFPGLINPEDYIETNFKIKNWHKQNEPGVLTMQFRIRSAKGSQIWIEDHLIGILYNNKKLMQGLMIDISDEKNRYTELLQLRTEWKEKEDVDDREKEIVFQDIIFQLNEIQKKETARKELVSLFLNHIKKNNISFEKTSLI